MINLNYHRVRFFLQWLSHYTSYSYHAIKTLIWGYKSGVKLSLKESFDFVKWVSFSKFTKNHHYCIRTKCGIQLIKWENFKEQLWIKQN